MRMSMRKRQTMESILMMIVILVVGCQCGKTPMKSSRNPQEPLNQIPGHWSLEEGAFYPGIPSFLKLPIGEIPVLHEAKSIAEIENWAQQNLPGVRMYQFTTAQPTATWIAVLYLALSGRQAWNIHLYVQPRATGDEVWRLVYVGGGGLETKHPDDIGFIQMNSQTRHLEILDKHRKLIKAISMNDAFTLIEKQ
jgi:hypothetical protein